MIVGHTKSISDLKRLADTQNLGHAYLFHGPSLVGKRLVAESFANYLENGVFSAEKGAVLLDAKIISPGETGSLGIDAVRELRDFLSKKPVKSARRTAIIDETEKMTAEAQNAMLHIAEEPPPSSLVILVASDAEAIFETLLSRLAKIYFSPIPVAAVSEWLEKEPGLKRNEAEELARNSFGKPGLAYALKNDKSLIGKLRDAEKLFAQKEALRREFIKKLIEPEDFNFNDFLDAVILRCATIWSHSKTNGLEMAENWHKLLELRSRTANLPLNPRLQLENLLS
jgi:DNA polymerase-3 subunit delta'